MLCVYICIVCTHILTFFIRVRIGNERMLAVAVIFFKNRDTCSGPWELRNTDIKKLTKTFSNKASKVHSKVSKLSTNWFKKLTVDSNFCFLNAQYTHTHTTQAHTQTHTHEHFSFWLGCLCVCAGMNNFF